MPKNYFKNREKRSMDPTKVKVGTLAFIVEKEKQGAKSLDELQLGLIKQKLSNGDLYKNGAKVKIAPLNKEIRKIIKPLIDEYYQNAILHFNEENYDLNKYVEDFNNKLEQLNLDLNKECSSYEGELIVGRIQYYLYPEEYKSKPEITTIKLGLSNNQLCDINTLQQQVSYIRSKYVIGVDNFDEIIIKLNRFRTLINTLDINTLKQMNIYPNYCEINIENNHIIKDIKYIEF